MSRPKAYDPEQNCYAQLFCRNRQYDKEWEHLDYADHRTDLEEMMANYAQAYRGTGYEIMYIKLPQKYWDKAAVEADRRARRDKVLASRRAAKQREQQQVVHQIFSLN